jgi:hypothetical protein
MGRATQRQLTSQSQDDPGESNDPGKSEQGGFDVHVWSTVHQIFERLGRIDQKIDQLTIDQKGLKSSVDKHDKLILRVTFTIAGAAAIITALWFIYEHFLKDHLKFI